MGDRTARRRILYSTFISWALLFAYLLAFYQSANTPLRAASFADVLEAASVGLAIAGSVAATVWLLAVLLNMASSRTQLDVWLLRLTAGPVIFVLALLVIENWFYSIFTVGLKSGDSLWLKVGFLILAGFVTYHGFNAISTGARWLAERGPGFAVGLLVVCVAGGAYGLSSGLATKTPAFSVNHEDALPHILFIGADGLSADFMSLYGYPEPSTPFLESIADELTIFEAAYVNNANTTGSITSLLSGISPATTKVIYPPDFLTDAFANKSLPRLLGDLGYYRSQWSVPHYASAASQGMIGAFDRVNGVSQQSARRAVDALPISNLAGWFLTHAASDAHSVILDALAIREMDNPYAQVAESEAHDTKTLPAKLSDATRLVGLNEDIDTALALGKPLFAQIHLMDTHGLKFYPSVRNFSAGMVQNDYWMTPFYLDSVAEFDRRLATLYAQLKERDMLNSTLIIIFSDHPQKWKTYLRVPLLMRFPSASRAGLISKNVQLLDLAPTIAHWLGGEPPEWMQGMSLLEPEQIPADRMLVATGFDSEVRSTGDGRGWQRAEVDGRPFRERNEFRVIHCGASTEILFPNVEIRFEPMPSNPSSEVCNTFSPAERTEKALRTLEQTLAEPTYN